MRAFIVDSVDGVFQRSVQQVADPVADDSEVLVRVAWSDVNYKDALAATADGKVVRSYPLVTGIDVAGTVEASQHSRIAVGQEVIATGYDLGVARNGGHAELVAIPADWVLPLPVGLDVRQAMVAGTAGLTAALCVAALADGGVTSGPVLVTGATGGVGSFAVALLARAGYEVVASTGRDDRSDWLMALGAERIMGRLPEDHRPLERETWAGVVDTVGGPTLAGAIAATRYRGVVAACGLTGSTGFATSVFPFILRGVRLQGVDSVQCPIADRQRAWDLLATDISSSTWELLAGRQVGLDDLGSAMDEVRAGRAQGRTLVCPTQG